MSGTDEGFVSTVGNLLPLQRCEGKKSVGSISLFSFRVVVDDGDGC